MNIGSRIKMLRETKGVTQTELANAIGTTKQNIYKYETGIITNIPSDKIEAISNFFNVSPAYIMCWTDNPSGTIPIDSSTSVLDIGGSFAQRLKLALDNADLIVEELAQLSLIDADIIKQYLDGSMPPKADHLLQLSNFFHVNAAWLIGINVVMETRPPSTPGSGYLASLNHTVIKMLEEANTLSTHEQKVIIAYREQPAMQPAVDKLLGVAADEKDEKEKIQPAKSGKPVSLPVNRPEEKSSETDANPDEGIRVFRAAKSINNDQPPQIVTLTKEQADLLDKTPFTDRDL